MTEARRRFNDSLGIREGEKNNETTEPAIYNSIDRKVKASGRETKR